MARKNNDSRYSKRQSKKQRSKKIRETQLLTSFINRLRLTRERFLNVSLAQIARTLRCKPGDIQVFVTVNGETLSPQSVKGQSHVLRFHLREDEDFLLKVINHRSAAYREFNFAPVQTAA